MKEKSLIDRNGKPITKSTVVKHADGWRRVASISVAKRAVNLRSIFGSAVTCKDVPVADVYEDYDNWSANWSKSESYRCM